MYDGLDQPLFGEARRKDRYFNYFIGGFTVLLVSETIISSIVFPRFPPPAINVFLAFVIALICISQLTLIYWYRQGDVDPKFKKMIYFNSVTTILLCVCANIYFHKSCL
ncbi:transmembrane protein 243-like [Montipora capricornis]|uniref:transmembrane protein 243-like n=1 Tax=Montipora foliosa TaxID=591990 RepID=UPI0035F1EE22